MRKSSLRFGAIAAVSLSLQPAIAGYADMTGGPLGPPITGEQWIKYCPQFDEIGGHGELSSQLLDRARWCAAYATGFADAMLVFVHACENMKAVQSPDLADLVTRYLIAHPSDRRLTVPIAIATAFADASLCVTKK